MVPSVFIVGDGYRVGVPGHAQVTTKNLQRELGELGQEHDLASHAIVIPHSRTRHQALIRTLDELSGSGFHNNLIASGVSSP